MTLTDWLTALKARIAAATRTEWFAAVTNKDCMDDLDMMRSCHRAAFNSEIEAREYASQFKHPKRPEYWQPQVWSEKRNDLLPASDLETAVRVIEIYKSAIDWYMENSDPTFYELVGGNGAPTGYLPYTGDWNRMNKALAEAERIVGGDNE